MEESTFIPLSKGEITIPTGPPKVSLPYNVLIEAHIAGLSQDRDTGVGLVQTTDNDGVPVQKIVVRFVVDSDIQDRETKEDLKSQPFSKWLPYKNTEKSALGKLRIATLGPDSESIDPTDIAGKPLLLMVVKDTFNGKEFDQFTYLPAAKGQTVPASTIAKDLLSEAEVDAALEKAFKS